MVVQIVTKMERKRRVLKRSWEDTVRSVRIIVQIADTARKMVVWVITTRAVQMKRWMEYRSQTLRDRDIIAPVIEMFSEARLLWGMSRTTEPRRKMMKSTQTVMMPPSELLLSEGSETKCAKLSRYMTMLQRTMRSNRESETLALINCSRTPSSRQIK